MLTEPKYLTIAVLPLNVNVTVLTHGPIVAFVNVVDGTYVQEELVILSPPPPIDPPANRMQSISTTEPLAGGVENVTVVRLVSV